MSSFIDFRTLPVNVPSLCIPRVFANVDENRIRRIFDDLNVGIIERIDIVRKTTEKGEKSNRVFIHFKHWFNNKNADVSRERLLNGKDIKIIYDDPWFWKVSAYRETNKAPHNVKSDSHSQKRASIQFDSDDDRRPERRDRDDDRRPERRDRDDDRRPERRDRDEDRRPERRDRDEDRRPERRDRDEDRRPERRDRDEDRRPIRSIEDRKPIRSIDDRRPIRSIEDRKPIRSIDERRPRDDDRRPPRSPSSSPPRSRKEDNDLDQQFINNCHQNAIKNCQEFTINNSIQYVVEADKVETKVEANNIEVNKVEAAKVEANNIEVEVPAVQYDMKAINSVKKRVIIKRETPKVAKVQNIKVEESDNSW
jgi:hypothetical protein